MPHASRSFLCSRLVKPALFLLLATWISAVLAFDSPADREKTARKSADPFADLAGGTPRDPFADLASGARPVPPPAMGEHPPASSDTNPSASHGPRTYTTIKQELLEQVSWRDGAKTPYMRLSYGGELLQRFTDDVKTWGSFDLQLRLVNRSAFQPVLNDIEGETRRHWFLEYHNAYLDLFNALDPFMSRSARAKNLGRFNARIGRFYLPFGLNLQTDTHGTVLQLSNERNFGFERDWYAGLWGGLNRDLNYDVYYLVGSGYDLRQEGQKGLLGLRFSLANRFLYESGWEGGISLMTGERLSPHALMRSPGVAATAAKGKIIETRRIGIDARYSRPISGGRLSATTELSGGRDEGEDIFGQLYQIEFLRTDRKLGAALQYRRFQQDVRLPAHDPMMLPSPGKSDASLIGDVTWYFRNDLGNASLHWIKLNVERQLETISGRRGVLTTLQYYRYW